MSEKLEKIKIPGLVALLVIAIAIAVWSIMNSHIIAPTNSHPIQLPAQARAGMRYYENGGPPAQKSGPGPHIQ